MPPAQMPNSADYLNDYDIESLLAAGPLIDSETTQFSNIEMDLDTMSLESFGSLLTDDLKINLNTLENVSSFAAILSPSMLNSMFTSNTMPLQCDTWSVTTRSENYSPSSLMSDPSMQSPHRVYNNQNVLGRQKPLIKKKSSASKSSGQLRQMDMGSCDDSDAMSDKNWSGSARNSNCNNAGGNVRTGRWTPDEHRKFLQGIAQHGRNWDKVAQNVLTRTTVQVRSHAQKYFKKLVHREGMGSSSKQSDNNFNCDGDGYGDDSALNVMTDEMIMERAKQELM